MRKGPWLLGLALHVGAFGLSHASAEDGELRLMGEPFSYTDVVDAFDEDDPFDLNVRLGFSRTRTTGTIVRERSASSGFGSSDVARWEHVQNVLDVGLDVGLYRDVALYARLPVILSDTRSLSLPGGRSAEAVAGDLGVTEPGEPPRDVELFSVPFRAPTRSGLDHVALGLAWAIFNQHRDSHLPTWVVMAEGRFGVGEVLRACNDAEAYSGDERCNGGAGPGMSRGVHALRLETRASKRFRYTEPYGGLSFQMEWPAQAKDQFAPEGNLAGYMNRLPPRVGELTGGLAVIPWENQGRWQRFALDFRFSATYISEGQNYSPLFDALGTSRTAYLREPNLEGIPTPGSELRAVGFSGLTEVAAHGRIGGRFAVELQAARYIRFRLGAGLFYTTPHGLTTAEACNPNVSVSADDPRRGRCTSGIINPHHRPVIDAPGNRFYLDGAFTLDLFGAAIAQF